MSAGMPELGSKISLISKADIRYEGRLFTVDPQECTIALANVRSFGTEDRETPYPIMPQPTVYDYILFRGSDIKDIRVVNNVAIPNDPAIMQMHLPPSQMQPQQNFPPQNFPPGGPVPQMAQFGPFGGMPAMQPGGNMPPQQAQSPVQQGNASNLAPGSGSGQKNKKSNSRSGTPQNVRKSPTSDMGSQSNQNQRGEGQAGGQKDKPQRNNQRNNPQQRERRDSARNENQENKGGYRGQNQNQRPNNNQVNNNQQQQQNRGGYNNRDNRNGNNGNNQARGNQGGNSRMRGPPMHMNNYRQQQQNNQGVQNQNKPNVPGQQQQNRPNNKSTKFDSEFDFEQANSKFEEFRSQFAKLKVGSEDPKVPEQVNGEAEKKDDSGNETGADNHEVENEETAYDKNKSFFDNISCEAVERSKGKTQRTDWRQERKINSETFGYSGFNRRGNYRGRGGYHQGGNYNRGPRQGGYRGNNPNYRPMRNYRNGNNANGAQANGQPQQSQNSAPVAAN